MQISKINVMNSTNKNSYSNKTQKSPSFKANAIFCVREKTGLACENMAVATNSLFQTIRCTHKENVIIKDIETGAIRIETKNKAFDKKFQELAQKTAEENNLFLDSFTPTE